MLYLEWLAYLRLETGLYIQYFRCIYLLPEHFSQRIVFNDD